MANNDLTELGDIVKINSLLELDLSSNRLLNIKSIKLLTDLTHLSLNNNQLEDVTELKHLNYLTFLKLNQNKIRNLDFIKYLFELFIVELENNQINDISMIRNLTKISQLMLKNNQINYIEINLFDKLTKLEILDLSLNNIREFDSMLPRLVKHVNISHNQMTNIPNVSHLKNLFRLDISFNKRLIRFDSIENILNSSILRQLFIDKSLIKYLNKSLNQRVAKIKSDHYLFLLSFHVNINDDLEYLNCQLSIDFIRRNIHLNLFYQEQLKRFLKFCNVE